MSNAAGGKIETMRARGTLGDWEVFEDPKTQHHPGAWVLAFLAPTFNRRGDVVGAEVVFIDICPPTPTFDYPLAVDAALEFIDRLRSGAIPRTIEDPKELMEMAFRNARRQR
jgi:hypothetical protein